MRITFGNRFQFGSRRPLSCRSAFYTQSGTDIKRHCDCNFRTSDTCCKSNDMKRSGQLYENDNNSKKNNHSINAEFSLMCNSVCYKAYLGLPL